MLENIDNLIVKDIVNSVPKTLDVIINNNYDILIVNINNYLMNGIEIIKQIIRTKPEIKIIAFSCKISAAYAKDLLNSGAMAYLCKNISFDELRNAIENILNGKKYICSSVESKMLDSYFDNEKIKKENALTKRETEILKYISSGLNYKEIAYKLKINTKTIGIHKSRLMNKLNIHNIADLTKYAIKEGYTSLEIYN